MFLRPFLPLDACKVKLKQTNSVERVDLLFQNCAIPRQNIAKFTHCLALLLACSISVFPKYGKEKETDAHIGGLRFMQEYIDGDARLFCVNLWTVELITTSKVGGLGVCCDNQYARINE